MVTSKPRRPYRSLRAQLLIYMILLILIPLLCVTLFGNYYYAQGIDEQATGYTAQMLEQIQINIDSNVHAIDQIIHYLSTDPDVLDWLRIDDFYEPSRVDLEAAARMELRRFVEANPGLISGMLVVNVHDLYISNEIYRVARYPLVEESWYQQAIAQDGKRLLISKPIGRNVRNYRNYSTNDIVSFVRAIKEPETGEMLGVICVDMELSVMESHIRDLTLGKNGYVFVMDGLGQIVYAPVNPSVYRIQSEWVIGRDFGVHTIAGENYQLMSTYSDLSGWHMVGVFKTGEILEPVLALRGYTLLFALIAVVIASIMAITLAASFTNPISRLRRLMLEAEGGNLNISFETGRYHGEVAQLGTSFNKMMEKIRTLLDLIYVEQKQKREADIKTLQAQIKPHFLYNTLDTIRWMAEERGAHEVARMVTALTKQFRIALSRGKDIISLGDELEHVRCYLYIQQVRYEDKLSYSFACDEALYPCRVNKLILQPLVENAIYHGIKQKRGAGHIDISVVREEDTLLLTVRDDGIGMSQTQCDAINEKLRSVGSSVYDHGYGIYNVNDRIRLSYGDAYGLRFSINQEGGVTAVIRHPAVRDAISEELGGE